MLETDNGEMTEKEKAIREEKTCGKCAKKFPPHLPLMMIEIPLEPGKIIPANTKGAVALCICHNPKSDEFQRVVNIFCGCKHCQKLPEPVLKEKENGTKSRKLL